MNTTDIKTMVYYVINYMFKPFSLQENTTIYVQVSKSGEPDFGERYLSEIQFNKDYIRNRNHIIIL